MPWKAFREGELWVEKVEEWWSAASSAAGKLGWLPGLGCRPPKCRASPRAQRRMLWVSWAPTTSQGQTLWQHFTSQKRPTQSSISGSSEPPAPSAEVYLKAEACEYQNCFCRSLIKTDIIVSINKAEHFHCWILITGWILSMGQWRGLVDKSGLSKLMCQITLIKLTSVCPQKARKNESRETPEPSCC